MPTIVISCVGPFSNTFTCWPTVKSPSLALPLSMMISCVPCGARPSTIVHGFSSGTTPQLLADAGSLSGAQRLPVRLHQLRVALHRAFGRGDALGALDGRDERGGEAAAHVAEVALEHGLTADERVGASVDVGEQVVEDLAHRVGEHERARP